MHTITKRFDLADRTATFAINSRDFIKKIPRSISTIEYGKQLLRSTASVGANYIEANESLSKKDFVMHVKISRKEAKESGYWLRLLDIPDGRKDVSQQRTLLVQEAGELVKIFNAIAQKSS